jgi:hypothetical protein
MTNDEIIEVIRAYQAGKKIQWREDCTDEWKDLRQTTTAGWFGWDFRRIEYRVAPEPRRPRECEIYFRNGSPEVRNFKGDYQMNGTSIYMREVLE